MTPEEMRRLSQLYGQQPPMGMAGSVPPAPAPQLGQMSPLQQQNMQQPAFSPVMQQTPQGAVNSMFQPQQGAMQRQLAPIAQGNVVQPQQTDPVASEIDKMRQEPQNQGGGADWKGMAKDLAKGLKSSGFGTGGIMSQKEIKNIGLLQEAKAPVAIGTAANQNAQQPGMSAAMQAITGSIGSQPGMLEMLKRMRR